MEYLSLAVHALTPEQGGRSAPFAGQSVNGSSYKPHLRTHRDGEYLGIAFIDGPEWIRPGDNVVATVALIYIENDVNYSSLVIGAQADVVEGKQVVATVQVLDRWKEPPDEHDS